MTSRRFVSLAAACAIGTMALAVPTLPVQAAPTSASTIVAVASVAPQTDAVSASAAPASSHNVLAPTRRFRYHGGRGSSDPVFGTISVIIFIGVCVWNVYNRRRRSRITQGRLQQNPPAYGGPVGPQYGVVAPAYNGRVPSGPQAMPYQPNGGGTSTMPNTGYGYGGAPGQQGYYPPQQGGQGYGQYPPTYR
ncbi:hypothetical protein [Actinomyces sp. ICM47]|uniref:hypothetical protein n=1 Tax=Actinomyces sp. ICM47 TaxID=936548 RepID=UPI0025B8C2F6|nr:hypothetical protein [Actinomyces sp. ICM47]